MEKGVKLKPIKKEVRQHIHLKISLSCHLQTSMHEETHAANHSTLNEASAKALFSYQAVKCL